MPPSKIAHFSQPQHASLESVKSQIQGRCKAYGTAHTTPLLSGESDYQHSQNADLLGTEDKELGHQTTKPDSNRSCGGVQKTHGPQHLDLRGHVQSGEDSHNCVKPWKDEELAKAAKRVLKVCTRNTKTSYKYKQTRWQCVDQDATAQISSTKFHVKRALLRQTYVLRSVPL